MICLFILLLFLIEQIFILFGFAFHHSNLSNVNYQLFLHKYDVYVLLLADLLNVVEFPIFSLKFVAFGFQVFILLGFSSCNVIRFFLLLTCCYDCCLQLTDFGVASSHFVLPILYLFFAILYNPLKIVDFLLFLAEFLLKILIKIKLRVHLHSLFFELFDIVVLSFDKIIQSFNFRDK